MDPQSGPWTLNQGHGLSIRAMDSQSGPWTLNQGQRPSIGARDSKTYTQGQTLEAYVIGPFGAAAPLTFTYY